MARNPVINEKIIKKDGKSKSNWKNMDVLEKIREGCDRLKVEEDSATESKLTEQHELPLIHIDTKERLQHLEAQLRVFTIYTEKKIVNSYKNLLKVKWFQNNEDQFVENLIFNDKTGYVKYVKLEVADPCKTDTLWLEIGKACENVYRAQ